MKNRLRVLRAEREWTQSELARRLGVSTNTANAIETGKYNPSLPLAFKIARLFELRIEDIFHPDPEPRPAGDSDSGAAEDAARAHGTPESPPSAA